jgi:hypothetical protein
LHDVLPHFRHKMTEPSDHGLEPLKLWAKINFSFFKLLISSILWQW